MTKTSFAFMAALTLGIHLASGADASINESKTTDDLKVLFQKLDANEDGTLSFDEFVKMARGEQKGNAKEVAAAPAVPKKAPPANTSTPAAKRTAEVTFKNVDKNHDGFLSVAELKTMNVFRNQPEMAERSFKKRDLDGDGSLTVHEFKSMGRRTAIDEED